MLCRSTYNFKPPFRVTTTVEEDATSGFKVLSPLLCSSHHRPVGIRPHCRRTAGVHLHHGPGGLCGGQGSIRAGVGVPNARRGAARVVRVQGAPPAADQQPDLGLAGESAAPGVEVQARAGGHLPHPQGAAPGALHPASAFWQWTRLGSADPRACGCRCGGRCWRGSVGL